jgi:hypothetical protein
MELQLVSNSVCRKCNKHFTCEVIAGVKSYWGYEFSQRELQGKGYLCPSCLGIIATLVNNTESLL